MISISNSRKVATAAEKLSYLESLIFNMFIIQHGNQLVIHVGHMNSGINHTFHTNERQS